MDTPRLPLFAFATRRCRSDLGPNDTSVKGHFGGARLFLQKPWFLRRVRQHSGACDVVVTEIKCTSIPAIEIAGNQ